MEENEMILNVTMIVWILAGIVFTLTGVLLLLIRSKRKANCTSIIKGKVTDIVKRKGIYDKEYGYSTLWHPVFEYTVDEVKYVKESNYGTSKAKFRIGQEVEIFYNPDDNNEYYVKEENGPKTLGVIFTIVGLILLFAAIVLHKNII